MSELDNYKLNDEILDDVNGGQGEGKKRLRVRDITPYWVRVICPRGIYCYYEPDGEIAKSYEYGHKLKVNGITSDNFWYRLLIYDPRGGTCDGYIIESLTERV